MSPCLQFRGPARQRGAIGLMAAGTLALALGFMLLVIDSGRLYLEQRKLQRVADTAALEARLARIPAERHQEAEAIETRYAKLNDRTFPVAVIFLVPESAVQGGAA